MMPIFFNSYARKNKPWTFVVVATIVLFFAAAASQDAFAVAAPMGLQFTADKPLSVAFIYPTAINDFGFSYGNEIGRVSVERDFQALGYNITTGFAASVAPADSAAVMEGFIRDGYQMIIAAGGQFYTALISVAAKHPEIKFVCTAGSSPTENVAVGYPRNWEVRRDNGDYLPVLLGFVAGFSNNNVHTRSFNAFYIGARAADATANLTLATVNSFLDAITEEKAAIALMNETQADCIGSMRSVFSVGHASDARLTTGEHVISSNIFDWIPYFKYWINNVYNGTWVPYEALYWGYAEGALTLAPFGTKTKPAIKRAIVAELDRIKAISGGFNPFCGEYAKQWNPDGSCLTIPQINKMNMPLSMINHQFNMTLDSVLIREYVSISSAASIVSIVWAAFFLALLLLSVVDLIIYRDTVAYRTSSPLFCGLIAVGILMIYISIFGWMGFPTYSLCAMRSWLAGIGFALIYGCILAKNWRVFRIFSDDSFKVFAITNFDLIVKWVLPVVVLEVAILIVWQVLDPLVPVSIPSPIAVDTRLQFCASKSPAGLVVLLAYKGVLVIFASALSYLTRRITSDFRESTMIALSVYNAIVIGLIIIVVNLIASNNVLVQYIITVFGILIIASVTQGLIFLPKFWRIHVVGDKALWSLSSKSGNTHNSSQNASSVVANHGRGSKSRSKSNGTPTQDMNIDSLVD